MASNYYVPGNAPPYITPGLEQDVAHLARMVNSGQLLIRHLQSILVKHGERTSGVKQELQKRVVNLLYRAARPDCEDQTLFARVKHSIMSARDPPPENATSSNSYTFEYMKPEQRPPMAAASGSSMSRGFGPVASTGRTIYFKPSPFHRAIEKIGDYHVLPVMTTHKNSKEIYIRSQDSVNISRCVTDRNYRVLVFCAADNTGIQDVAFPSQAEIRVNDDEVKANLRGIKNKPGTTRPVDITSMLRLKVPTYRNKVTFRYALTHKDYYLQLFVCRVNPVADLVASIETGKKISKETVKNWLSRKGEDGEVEATSQVLSLKCPLSYVRISLPCRTPHCRHVACFDATAFLQLQEQAPQWLCPICNGPAKFEQLAVDEYVRDILTRTPETLDQVTIAPDGNWIAQEMRPVAEPRPNVGSVVEVEDISLSEDEAPPARPGPSADVAPPSSASKRKAAEVIDLTLDSSDEDDEPLTRPAKRPYQSMDEPQPQTYTFPSAW